MQDKLNISDKSNIMNSDPAERFLNLKGRIWKGVVIKKASEKTAVVLVTRVVEHKIYKIRHKKYTKFQSHDLLGVSVGDRVTIQECRKISKTKATVIIEREA